MTFVKGVSGNPGGRPQEKLVTEALRTAALRTDKEGKTKLYRMADTIMDKAVAGEPWAAQMVADRLEGKPVQQLETSVEMGASELFLEVLRRMQPQPQIEPKTIEHESGK